MPAPASTPAEPPITPAPYRALLIRCWRDENGWRFAVEQTDDAARHGFSDVHALTDFLLQMFALGNGPNPLSTDIAISPGSAGRNGNVGKLSLHRQAGIAHQSAVQQANKRHKH